ncbi:hypothetical protein Pmar_PMAR019207 [Perkinsus marinus ATCC 50983]|uniref:Uncharacterized protein n=1 Tax=Perkinsus marinus (strain ATCC 50983 / TXsc) TaxID=423536 RepID=C5KU59_PERM5|nr:hypothetical protein Pmar_PMAR019207 [Perkinsus marinus ATCC 50983]EER12101.1 hypothetical protein Pmar_PMAR019207 [Perkinsus marinus ATCC 50983]|eukprot:XP_002780306.1 hypothetical protein Pmar_PMAR019207 [Perkinsus marinus ATCC 50983]
MSISSNLMSSGAEDVDIQYAEAEGSKGGVGRRGGVTTQKPICGYYKKDRCQLGPDVPVRITGGESVPEEAGVVVIEYSEHR